MAKSRRFLGIILSLAMILLLLPVQGMAAEAKTTTVKTEAELSAALAAGDASVKLDADIALAKPVSITKAVVLDLGGHTVTLPMYVNDEDPAKNVAYGVTVNAPDAAVTITNGKWVCGEGNDQITFLDHKEGVLTLSDLEVQAPMGVYIEARVETIENCTLTCKGSTDGEMFFGGLSLNLDIGGEIGTVKNCTLVGTVASAGLEVYAGALTPEFKEQYPEAYANMEEMVQKGKATGRDTGHIDSIVDTSIARVADWMPGLHLQPGAVVDLMKNVTITGKGYEGSGIIVSESEIGEIADCTLEVSDEHGTVGLEAFGSKIGTISGVKATVQSDESAGVFNFLDGTTVDNIQDCTLIQDSPDGDNVGVFSKASIGTIQNCVITNKQTRVDPDGNKQMQKAITVNEFSTVDTIDDVVCEQGDITVSNGTIGRITNVTANAIAAFDMTTIYHPETDTTEDVETDNKIGTVARCTLQGNLELQRGEIGAVVDNQIGGDVNHWDGTIGLFARNTVKGNTHLRETCKEALDNTFEGDVLFAAKADKFAYNTCTGELTLAVESEIGTLGPNPFDKDTVVDNQAAVKVIADEGVLSADGKTFIAESGWSLRGDGKIEKAEPLKAVSYTDVAEDIWYAEGVDYVTTRGLMDAAETFEPDAVASRDTIMAILARMEGETISKAGEGMDWAKSVGISDGTNPDNPLTREQLAMVLYNLAGKPEVSEADKSAVAAFGDAGDVSAWAMDGVAWALSNKIINGTGTALAPKLDMTRGMLAQLIYNLYG